MSVQMKLTDARAQLSNLCKGNEIVDITIDGKVVATLYPKGLAPGAGTHAPQASSAAPNLLGADVPSPARLVPAPKVLSHAPYDTPEARDLLRRMNKR